VLPQELSSMPLIAKTTSTRSAFFIVASFVSFGWTFERGVAPKISPSNGLPDTMFQQPAIQSVHWNRQHA
jgi:hypothetical protein